MLLCKVFAAVPCQLRSNQTSLKSKSRFSWSARAEVDRNVDPQMHLPPAVYKFFRPIVNSTCQGCYSCTAMGGMAALTNGAQVQIRSQKRTPLVAAVFQIGEPQSGKSRMFQVKEEVFVSCEPSMWRSCWPNSLHGAIRHIFRWNSAMGIHVLASASLLLHGKAEPSISTKLTSSGVTLTCWGRRAEKRIKHLQVMYPP